jgi:hypothetical protein
MCGSHICVGIQAHQISINMYKVFRVKKSPDIDKCSRSQNDRIHRHNGL